MGMCSTRLHASAIASEQRFGHVAQSEINLCCNINQSYCSMCMPRQACKRHVRNLQADVDTTQVANNQTRSSMGWPHVTGPQ